MTRSLGKGIRPRIYTSGPQGSPRISAHRLEKMLHGDRPPPFDESPTERMAREAADEARANIEAANRKWLELQRQ